jgi:hypothetical protein
MKRFIIIVVLMTCTSGYVWADDCVEPGTGKPIPCTVVR